MPRPELPPLPDNLLELLEARRAGFNETLGLHFVEADYDHVVAELEIGPHLLQPYGLVHGGVYSSIIETVASVGAALNVMPLGLSTVGLENSTSFLRGVREGTLRAHGTPLTRGRRTHVWQVEVRDAGDRLAASGRVRMICIEPGGAVGGKKVEIES